jgi:CHAT domain-containing protein/tetratricopeptide (TPR) repeat protein
MLSAMGLIAALCLTAAGSAFAKASEFDRRLDAAYTDIGRGNLDAADEQAIRLLKNTGPADPRRARVLQLQLDACVARHELGKPHCAGLQNDIAVYAAHAKSDALLHRFEITQALDTDDAVKALDVAQTIVASSSAADLPELRVLIARAAALIPGKMDTAREQAALALSTWKARAGSQARLRESELLYILASAAQLNGSRSDALSRLETGIDVTVKAFGADSYNRFRFDAERAAILVEMGRYREALAAREDMLALAQKRFGERSLEAAKCEAHLGAGLQEIGDRAASREHYERAIAMMAVLPEATANDRALVAANFGNLLQEMGEEQAAIEQYRFALTQWGTNGATMHARAVVSANVGNTEFRLQHFEAAIGDFRQAFALREQSDGKESPGLAYSLEGLGSSSLALGRFADAEKFYRHAIDVRGKALAPNHPTLAPLTFGLALARWGQGNEDDAFRIAVETARHQQDMLAAFAADFSDRQSAAYRDLLMPATALAVTLAARSNDNAHIAMAWRLVMNERGLVARTEAHRLAAARSLSDPALAKAFAAWHDANSALGEAWLSNQPDATHLAELKSQSERAERSLWSHAVPEQVRTASAAVGIDDIARALPADALLLAYTEGVMNDPARQLRAGGNQTPEDWYAFALRHDGQIQLKRVGNVDALSAQLREWYLALRNPESDLSRMRNDGGALRHVLLDPFSGGKPVRHLFLVPEGELYRLSFAALPDAKQGYLIESGVSVHTLANEYDVVARTPIVGAATLLAGAPAFASAKSDVTATSRQLCVRAAQEGFAAIPNAARELDDLRALLSASSSQITVVRGVDATKQHVIDALTQANIVHLATHGFSLDESCAEAAGSRGVMLGRAASSDASGAESTSVVSGLAFAGANVIAGQAPIGILSAGELATLDLSKVSWVALSACDSGLGPIGRNEGVFGMRRALRLAGARTVVMSLWQVDDEATADLMEALYRQRFVAHDDIPDAMAAAMRAVVTSRRAEGKSDHPYYWAAFVSEGSWR